MNERIANRVAVVPAVLPEPLAAGPGQGPTPVVIGLGCDRGASLATFEAALARVIEPLGSPRVCRLATIDRKSDEPAILALAAAHGWPLVIYPAMLLARVQVPNPSPQVMRHLGIPAVAEAAALLAAGARMQDLLVEKWRQRGADGRHITLAVARWRAAPGGYPP
ncbi:MAG: cobalamin biosynthesis protein [Sphingobacteriia bacterium]|nr:cobalamin biosynthesis protein [Sphingobacteriia bacterium]NCC41732.1 cobalamin biosynthesis protein [Gammaproteobacteria bacterium]